jgi:hypothetical protein
MALWGSQINQVNFTKNSSEQIATISSNLNMIAWRIEDLFVAHKLPQSQKVKDKLNADFLKWYKIIYNSFLDWSDPLNNMYDKEIKQQILKDVEYLMEEVKKASKKEYGQKITEKEKENLYNLVTCISGLSDAAVAFSKTFDKTDWVDWNKEVFS